MKFSAALLILFFMVFQGTVALAKDPCRADDPSDYRFRPTGSLAQAKGLADFAINASVDAVNESIENSVEKKLVDFRLTTEMLAKKSASKEAISDWYFNMTNLNKLAFEEIRKTGIIKDDSEMKRIAFVLVSNIVSGWLSKVFSTTMHEKAHGEAADASGATSVHYSTRDNQDKSLSIGELFTALLGGESGAITHYEFDGPIDAKTRAAIAGAGLNKNISFAEDLANESIKNDQFHQAEYSHYLINKLSVPLYYSLGDDDEYNDLTNYAESLAKQGKIPADKVDATIKEVNRYSALSALLSGRTWEGMNATMNYIKKGDPTAETMRMKTPLGEVSWPEVSTYLNSDSVSVKVATNVKVSSRLNLDLAYEDAVIGEETSEVSFMAHVKKGKATYSAGATVNTERKSAFKAQVAYDLQKGWYLYANVVRDKGTLAGARQTDLDEESTSFRAGLGYRE